MCSCFVHKRPTQDDLSLVWALRRRSFLGDSRTAVIWKIIEIIIDIYLQPQNDAFVSEPSVEATTTALKFSAFFPTSLMTNDTQRKI